MESSGLLPALQQLPGSTLPERQSFRDTLAGIVSMDRSLFAAEFTSAISFGLWPVLDHVNVDDSLTEAYTTRWPDMSKEMSIHDKWQELLESGEGIETNEWFFSGLKGQLGEFNAKELLEAEGYTRVNLASSAANKGWDISAINPEGQGVLIQVKTGGSYSVGDVEGLLNENPDYLFALGSEIHEKAIASGIDINGQIIANIGPDLDLVEGIDDGLKTLSANMGIDIPDGIVDAVPHATVIVGGARLIYSFLATEKDFSAADRTTRNQIQVVQTLTLMSRMGVATVLATAGGMAGGTVGSAIPGVGNVIAGAAGTMAGAGRRDVSEQTSSLAHAGDCA